MVRQAAIAYCAMLIAVFIWGANFVVVKKATEAWKNQEFTFLAMRFSFALIVYIIVINITKIIRGDKKELSSESPLEAPAPQKGIRLQIAIQAGVVGVFLALGYGLQTWYLSKGEAVNAAFLTSTTVLFAPMLAFALRQKVYAATWIGAALAMAGIVFIEDISNLPARSKDLLAIGAAIAFALEMLLVQRFAPKIGSLQWTATSCAVVAIIMTVAAMTEEWKWPEDQTWPRIFSVAFTGLFATAVALGLQNWAQAQDINGKKIIDAPRAAILASLEPVFTTITSSIFLDKHPSGVPALGCLLILIGTMYSEFAAAKRVSAG